MGETTVVVGWSLLGRPSGIRVAVAPIPRPLIPAALTPDHHLGKTRPECDARQTCGDVTGLRSTCSSLCNFVGKYFIGLRYNSV